ncbi:MAG TPA: hypothetical protein VJL59_01425 [Anaerolineales bacterium]|nr:hypothetical protein [Anaerolineales bacterium]
MNAVIDWLLEKDNPSVRYFTLKHLLDRPDDDREVQSARRAIMRSEPVRKILAAQNAEGYWVKPGSGYSPKYQSTVWQILFLAEFGADGRNRQVRRGVEYLLSHAQADHGGFSAYNNAASGGAVHCLNGNLIWALVALGYSGDERVRGAVEWLAGAATGDDFDRWYATTPGPGFVCGVNMGQPCAWGAVKSLRALATLRVPPVLQTAKAKKAKEMAAEFFLSRDLAKADYPYTRRVSGEWFKFGFPLSYTSDVLEASLALCEAGCGRDARLTNAIELVISKRDADGRWAMKHSLNGKMWVDVEKKGQPSKWVTLRAMRVLKAAGRE